MINKSLVQIKTQKIALFSLFTFIFIVSVSTIRGFVLPETDVLWETRAGLDFFKTGHIPTTDSWNWLLEGHSWIPNSWLWNILLASFYNTAGIIGLCILSSIINIITFLLIWKILIKLGITSKLVQFGIICVTILGLFSWLTVRPQSADFILLLVFFITIIYVNKFTGWKQIILLCSTSLLLSILWMNFHLTGFLGVCLFTASFWVISVLYKKDTIGKRLLFSTLIFIIGFIGLFVTPFGLTGVTKIFTVTNASEGLITGWSSPNFVDPISFTTWIVLLYSTTLVFFTIKNKQWVLTLCILLLIIASFEAIRFTPFLSLFVLLTTPLLFPKKHKHIRSQHVITLVKKLVYILTILVTLFTILFVTIQVVHPSRITTLNPADFKNIPYKGKLLTLQDGGGTVELFRVDVSVSLDGRNDLIGKKQFLKIIGLFTSDQKDQVNKWVVKHQVSAVFVEPEYEHLNKIMKQLGWKQNIIPNGVLWVK